MDKILKKISTDFYRVTVVYYSYCKLVSELEKRPHNLKMTVEGTNLWNNCVKFAEFCLLYHLTVSRAILIAFDKWLEWCMKKGMEYPPLQIVVCKKSIELIHAEVLPTFNHTQNEIVDSSIRLLKGYPKDMAKELIECGFLGVDVGIIKQVKEKLGL